MIQQLGGQEASRTGGAGERAGGGHRARGDPLRACRRDAGEVKPESILPLSAEIISGPWTRAEEVFEEGHVATVAVFLL